MTEHHFKDHFSGHAASYAAFRPVYPEALFDWLAQISPGRDLAWDCATGSGQAARGLARHFRRVIATDASAEQIGQAEGPANIDFLTEPAESCSAEAGSVDLVTVAQAYHWFDHPAFLQEIERVLRPDGVLALWAYQLASVSREVDAVVLQLYAGPLDAYWPPERRWVESGYRDFEFPWPDLAVPAFHMQLEWSLEAFIGYLRTWSATRRHLAATGKDAVGAIEPELRSAWGAVAERTVRWPLNQRVFRAGKF